MDRFVIKAPKTECNGSIDKNVPKKRKIYQSDEKSCDHLLHKKLCKTPCKTEFQPAQNETVEDISLKFIESSLLKWDQLSAENLNCTYCILLSRSEANKLLRWCEGSLEYLSKELSRIRIMGKYHDIPRKQVAMGDPGLQYNFSGKTLTATAWAPVVKNIRDTLEEITGYKFNFVLINRYKDGDDHIGEHQDDEKELVAKSPIASLTLGQARDFVFRHKDSRGKNAKRKIATKKIELKHGMLLLMNYPTNSYWYHSLPKRKRCPGIRINMTFRVFHPQQFKK